MKIAVVAHTNKKIGGGLPALRRQLARRGRTDVSWYEVRKSAEVGDAVRAAVLHAPDLLLLWGGDGTVQHAVDAMVRTGMPQIPIGVIPAGTSNLFAANLGIPHSLRKSLDIALDGTLVALDVASFNGTRFAIMAGVGFDARMIAGANGKVKKRLGRAAYVYSGTRNLRQEPSHVTICVDGEPWFSGDASCVLVGNMADLFGGITMFDKADPTDGRLDLAVLHAQTLRQWVRLAGRAVCGSVGGSPLLTVTSGSRIEVDLDRKTPYELDGGAAGRTRHVKVRVKRHAITVRVAGSSS